MFESHRFFGKADEVEEEESKIKLRIAIEDMVGGEIYFWINPEHNFEKSIEVYPASTYIDIEKGILKILNRGGPDELLQIMMSIYAEKTSIPLRIRQEMFDEWQVKPKATSFTVEPSMLHLTREEERQLTIERQEIKEQEQLEKEFEEGLEEDRIRPEHGNIQTPEEIYLRRAKVYGLEAAELYAQNRGLIISSELRQEAGALHQNFLQWGTPIIPPMQTEQNMITPGPAEYGPDLDINEVLPVTSAGFNLSTYWPILAIIGVGALVMLRKGGGAPK